MVAIPWTDGRPAFTPGKILCAAGNYAAHLKEFGDRRERPEPEFFLKPVSALLADGGTILLPRESKRVEHEVELGVVIGAPLRRADPAAVPAAIAGYLVILDITARDLQLDAKKAGRPWTASKGFDTFAPVSPAVAAPAVRSVDDLEIGLSVNGTVRQRGRTSSMIHPVPALVAAASQTMRLEPGDIIATGTPDGVGVLQNGDEIEAWIDRVGRLRLRVGAER